MIESFHVDCEAVHNLFLTDLRRLILHQIPTLSPWALLVPQGYIQPACQCRKHGFDPWIGKIHWGVKWQPTKVFLPEKSPGQRSLVGYSPCDCKRVRHALETKQ